MNFIFLNDYHFKTLKDRNLSFDDIENLILNNVICEKVTDYTKCLLLEINRYFNNLLFNIFTQKVIFPLNDIERQNIKEKLCELKVFNDSKDKYYEFFRVSGNTVFVVFSDSFLNYVTRNKENYLEFLLNSLCYLYDNNCFNESILRRYILFKNRDTNINYLLLRVI